MQPDVFASLTCMNDYRYCILCLAAISGCSNTSSENVTTQGIHADIDVVADGSGMTVVTAELEVGSGGLGRTSLELGSGDSLAVMANGIQKAMTENSSILGQFSYTASFDFDNADTMFTVSFSRVGGMSAPGSNVALPDGFLVQSPTASDIYRTNENIRIVWTPAGTSIVPTINVSLSCTLTSGLRMSAFETVSLSSDSGVAALPVAAVMPNGPLDSSRLCEGSVLLLRWRRGNLDPNYGEGGQITAEQSERAQFFVDPGP